MSSISQDTFHKEQTVKVIAENNCFDDKLFPSCISYKLTTRITWCTWKPRCLIQAGYIISTSEGYHYNKWVMKHQRGSKSFIQILIHINDTPFLYWILLSAVMMYLYWSGGEGWWMGWRVTAKGVWSRVLEVIKESLPKQLRRGLDKARNCSWVCVCGEGGSWRCHPCPPKKKT